MSEKENITEVCHGRRADSSVRQLPYRGKQPKRGSVGHTGVMPVPHNASRAGRRGREGGRVPQRREGVREKVFPRKSSRQVGTQVCKTKPTPVSLNHLLNFTVVPREHSHGNAPSYTRRRRSKVTHSYNKEQFLQSNCQFVVTYSGEYGVHSQDPDQLVDWQRIEQVRLFCHEIPSCPICLYPPRGAKITRCGHVFCWSCVLHYLSLGEKKWRKCPICYESIYRSDLRSVVALSSPHYNVGDAITMTLMMREKSSTHVMPKAKWVAQSGLPTLEDAPTNCYAKLVSAMPAQVLELITGPEKAQLRSQLATLGADEASERSFIESALEELETRETNLRQSVLIASEVEAITQDVQLAPSSGTLPEPGSPRTGVWSAFTDDYVEREFKQAFSESEEEEEADGGWSGSSESQDDSPRSVEQVTLPGKEDILSLSDGQYGRQFVCPSSSPELPVSRSMSTGEFIYFYQAFDGQHLYLHPISAKCVAKEYGALEHCPDTITARVLEMERLSVTEEIRVRYRYLSHLPLTCELVLCELDLRPPTVSRETLRLFSDELQRRRQKRQRKKREEQRRERRVSPPRVPVLGPPAITAESLHDLLSVTVSSPLSTTSPTHEVGERSEVNGTVPSSGPSFAQALRGKPPGISPTAKSPITQQSVLPEEGSHTAPTFQEAFNDALLCARTEDRGGKPGSKTARKGRKKLVLFSTEGARGTS